jgi:hypothetical protein
MPLDVHGYVLGRLDAHLAQLQALRAQLSSTRRSRPGERFYQAAATAVSAQRYARDIAAALLTCSAAPSGEPGAEEISRSPSGSRACTEPAA